mmetsp:Transcript_135217/g.269769  ORF Transcript_135217/g.269769 Transcript_135217/m.269769 type:complete len:226 (-) Transcript_135217:240-917(-)
MGPLTMLSKLSDLDEAGETVSAPRRCINIGGASGMSAFDGVPASRSELSLSSDDEASSGATSARKRSNRAGSDCEPLRLLRGTFNDGTSLGANSTGPNLLRIPLVIWTLSEICRLSSSCVSRFVELSSCSRSSKQLYLSRASSMCRRVLLAQIATTLCSCPTSDNRLRVSLNAPRSCDSTILSDKLLGFRACAGSISSSSAASISSSSAFRFIRVKMHLTAFRTA